MYAPLFFFSHGREKIAYEPEHLLSRWPFFFDQEDYEAMQTESPVPVFTCWNGIVVFTADPVLPIHLRSNGTRGLSRDPLPLGLPATHPAASDPALRGPSPALTPPIGFRASAPAECFSSESFLLPYDLRRVFGLERILVNPRVVVGYDWRYVCASLSLVRVLCHSRGSRMWCVHGCVALGWCSCGLWNMGRYDCGVVFWMTGFMSTSSGS